MNDQWSSNNLQQHRHSNNTTRSDQRQGDARQDAARCSHGAGRKRARELESSTSTPNDERDATFVMSGIASTDDGKQSMGGRIRKEREAEREKRQRRGVREREIEGEEMRPGTPNMRERRVFAK